MNIFEKLNLVTLENNSQATLASYLLELDNYDDLSIQQLVDNAYISSATASRLAKKVGLSGFAELKYRLIQENKNDCLSFYQTLFSDELITNMDYYINRKFNDLNSFNKTYLFTYSDQYNYLKYLDNIFFSTDYSVQTKLLTNTDNILYIFITDSNINKQIVDLSKNVSNKLIISTSNNINGDLNINNKQSLITMLVEYISLQQI